MNKDDIRKLRDLVGQLSCPVEQTPVALEALCILDAALAAPADDSVVWHSIGELEQAIKDAARFRFMQGNQSIKFWDGLAKLQSGEWGEYIDAAMGVKP